MNLHLRSIDQQELVNLFEKMLLVDPDTKRILDFWQVIKNKFSDNELDSAYYADMLYWIVTKHKSIFKDDLETLIDLMYSIGEKRGNAMSSEEAKKFYLNMDKNTKKVEKVINQVFRKRKKLK